MTMQNASTSRACDQIVPCDTFMVAHQVGVRDYLHHFQSIPLTTLDIDCFIYTTITNPAHSRAWNAGYLAGWLAGMASVEGSTDYVVAQIRHEESAGTTLYLVEVDRS